MLPMQINKNGNKGLLIIQLNIYFKDWNLE